jgi:cell division transport system permease protein
MSAYVSQHFAAFKSALRRLATSPLNTLLSLVVIGAALTLPAAGWVVLDNLQHLAGNTPGHNRSASSWPPMPAVRTWPRSNRVCATSPGRRVAFRFPRGRAEAHASDRRHGRNRRRPAQKPAARRLLRRTRRPQPETLERLAKASSRAGRRSPMCNSTRPGASVSMPSCASAAGGDAARRFVRRRADRGHLQHHPPADPGPGCRDRSRPPGRRHRRFIRRPFHYFGMLQGALGGLCAAVLVAVGFHMTQDELKKAAPTPHSTTSSTAASSASAPARPSTTSSTRSPACATASAARSPAPRPARSGSRAHGIEVFDLNGIESLPGVCRRCRRDRRRLRDDQGRRRRADAREDRRRGVRALRLHLRRQQAGRGARPLPAAGRGDPDGAQPRRARAAPARRRAQGARGLRHRQRQPDPRRARAVRSPTRWPPRRASTRSSASSPTASSPSVAPTCCCSRRPAACGPCSPPETRHRRPARGRPAATQRAGGT